MRVYPGEKKRAKRGRPGTFATLLVLIALASVMAVGHTIASRNEVALATGTRSDAQLEFFLQAADRPDLKEFYESLDPAQRLSMARNIAQYDQAGMAKLLAKLLASIDPQARSALSGALKDLAKRQPAAVADQLSESSGFPRTAVFSALHSLGDSSLSLAAERLAQPSTRDGAIAFLVESGGAADESALAVFRGSTDWDTKLAAAKALGQLRARSATHALLDAYRSAPPERRLALLGSIAAIGDPESQDEVAAVALDESAPPDLRAQAAVGLGRIGSVSGASTLWRLLGTMEPTLASAVRSALIESGDNALLGEHDPTLMVAISAASKSAAADEVLAGYFGSSDRSLRLRALRSAGGHPRLAGRVFDLIRSLDPSSDGDLIQAAVDALRNDGRPDLLAGISKDPRLAGFVERRDS